MKTYLVTGGAGFIGSHLVEALCARGDRAIVLDNLSTGSPDNLPAEVALVEGDIAGTADLTGLMAQVDGCFHLAAIASVQQYREGWGKAAGVNLIGSVRVLEAAARAGVPVVYASSAAVYGDNPAVPLAETAPVAPISGYGADKLGLELHAGAMGDSLGLATVGLRFFNVFGPRQAPGSPYSGVISIFFDRLSRGEPVTVFGDGEQSRDFVYVADVVRALIASMGHAMTRGRGVFNVCTGRATTVNALARIIAGRLGVEARILRAPARAGDIRESLGDGGRARCVLGFSADTAVADGLDRTADWFAGRIT